LSFQSFFDGDAASLIADEVVCKSKKNKDLVMFKVDFKKRYDSVEWDYLDVVINIMNVPLRWRCSIFKFLYTAIKLVLVKASSTNEFTMGRGLRERYPVFHFLIPVAFSLVFSNHIIP